MRYRLASLLPLLAVALALTAGAAPKDAPQAPPEKKAPPPVVVMSFQGPIGPAIADFVSRGLSFAQRQGAQLVVLQIDTPGGLDTSMRQIIKDILASPIPVTVFVGPRGARAASAGTYILYAAHIAAMAPGTNLGAATPVQIGAVPQPQKPEQPADEKEKPQEKEAKDGQKDGAGDKAQKREKPPSSAEAMRNKQIHDAAAYIRGLAQLRGRNAEWAEKAVREAVSLSAEEAAKINVVDLVAEDVNDLLKKLQGKEVETTGQKRVLQLADAPRMEYLPDWRTRLLAIITDPSVAYILMLIGIYGLFFEFSNPGFVLPGVVGAICLLLALFAFQLLPVNYAGLALILLGIAFMIGEAFLPSFGVLGIGGIAAFVIGSIMLIDTEVPGYGVPWELIGVFALVSAAFLILVLSMAMRARKRPVVSGVEEMVGAIGEMLEDAPSGEGLARVHSELWRVRAKGPLSRGQRVRVTAVKDLMLEVAPVDSN
ncbi:NfeD family protein [Pelomicrobium methylotrophicum]|uniref:Nodulation protein NfeD n=1 Tax=Pelomicrobium methylotrophicum TaxID=2602750 RepID=A0A5C7EKK3_9PROT|nr:nodulation protein NfeD [Pelomicrobium methylotrophicum]TXF12039.1 nodulation protein NfeD [Pelomicrobium methylotrophicum]